VVPDSKRKKLKTETQRRQKKKKNWRKGQGKQNPSRDKTAAKGGTREGIKNQIGETVGLPRIRLVTKEVIEKA